MRMLCCGASSEFMNGSAKCRCSLATLPVTSAPKRVHRELVCTPLGLEDRLQSHVIGPGSDRPNFSKSESRHHRVEGKMGWFYSDLCAAGVQVDACNGRLSG